MAQALVPISKQTLSSNTPSVTFTGFASTFRDLYLVVNWGLTGSGDNILCCQVNSQTTNYSTIDIIGQGTGFTPNANSRADTSMILWRGTNDGTIKALTTVNFMDYSQTDRHKIMMARTSGPTSTVAAISGRWASTSAITSITVLPFSGGNLASGSTLMLYGRLG